MNYVTVDSFIYPLMHSVSIHWVTTMCQHEALGYSSEQVTETSTEIKTTTEQGWWEQGESVRAMRLVHFFDLDRIVVRCLFHILKKSDWQQYIWEECWDGEMNLEVMTLWCISHDPGWYLLENESRKRRIGLRTGKLHCLGVEKLRRNQWKKLLNLTLLDITHNHHLRRPSSFSLMSMSFLKRCLL